MAIEERWETATSKLLVAALGVLFFSGPALGLEVWTKEGERWSKLVRRGDRKAKGWTGACGTAVEHTATDPSRDTGSFANAKALATTSTTPASDVFVTANYRMAAPARAPRAPRRQGILSRSDSVF